MMVRHSSRLLGVTCFVLSFAAVAQSLRVSAIDVGQGDSMVVVAPGGCAALFDGGPTGAGTAIKGYLTSIGVTRIDLAFTSHFHADHLGGLDEVDVGVNAVPIAAVYDRGGTYPSTAFSSYDSHFSGRRFTATQGQTFSLCGEVTLTVVAVNGNGTLTSNENGKSLVVKVTWGAFDALIGGDLTGSSPDIESLLGAPVGEIELYKVHHHGSRYSSNATMLAQLQPTVSFISVGVSNSYGHPTAECLGRLAAVGSAVWQTEDPASNTIRGHIELSSASGASFTVRQGFTSATYPSKGVPPVDTEPPTAPGALAASSSSSSQVDLNWLAATDAVGVTGYRVYRSADGVGFALAGSSSTTGFVDLGLPAGTTRFYRVTAVDAAGNESNPSAVVSATTLSPTLTLVSPNGAENWVAGTEEDLRWTSSDVATLQIEYSVNGGGSYALVATGVSSSLGLYRWAVPPVATSQARVRIADEAGGATDVSDADFTITAGAPGRIILNEILANEPGSATAGELIELVNVGGQAVSIEGWQLRIGATTRHTFAAGTRLQPGKAIVVFAGASAIPRGLTNAVAASTGSLGLVNGGASVQLRAFDGSTVDAFTYPAALASQDGVSMNRSPDATANGVFVRHTTMAAAASSPGTRPNGAAY